MEDDDYYIAFNVIIIILLFVFLFYTIYDYRRSCNDHDHDHDHDHEPHPRPNPNPTPAPQVTPAPTATPNPNVLNPAYIPMNWIDASGEDFNSSGNSVAFGNGVWIACGVDVTSTIKSSSDNGVTWSNMNNLIPATNNGGVFGITTDGNGKWVAVGNQNTEPGGKTIIFSSDNGSTWNSSANGFNTHNERSDRGWAVKYANNIWMAVGHSSIGDGYERWVKVATTFDPVNGPAWVDKPAGTGEAAVGFGLSNPAMCLAYGNGRWCVGGQNYNAEPYSSIIFSNDNGTTWTRATGTFKGQCQGIATDGNGKWVAVGMLRIEPTEPANTDAKPIKYSSDNGATWTDTTTLAANLFEIGTSVTYQPLQSGGIWLATGSGNSKTILYSVDNGVTWNTAGSNRFAYEGSSVHYNGNRWVAVGNGGASSIKYSLLPSPNETPAPECGTDLEFTISNYVYQYNEEDESYYWDVSWVLLENGISYTVTSSEGTVSYTSDTTATISILASSYDENDITITLTAQTACGPVVATVSAGSCFLEGAMVSMADGTQRPIETIKVGDELIGAFGEINTVLALHRPKIGMNLMCCINDEHHTTNHHPHITIDKKFYCGNPRLVNKSTYGQTHKVINGDGKESDMFLHGLEPRRINRFELGLQLKTIEGQRELKTMNTYSLPANTQLYNLVMSGSHTYHVDGYAVTGWPREDDFNYDTWSKK